MRHSVGSWTIRLIERTLEIGVGNPFALVRFAPRVLRAAGGWAKNLLGKEAGTVLGPVIAQTGRSFFRGIWLVLALGLALATGLRAAAQAVGPMIEPIAERAAVKILVVDGIPLLLAVFLSGRIGATMAARLGPLPAIRGLATMRVRDEELRDLVLPSLTAGPIVAAAFYYLVLLFAAAGYQAVGPLPGSAFEVLQPFLPDAWRPGLETGLAKSAVFGFVVPYVGAALGVQSAERYHRDLPHTADVHRAVWESSALSVLVCLLVTVFWSTLE